MKQKLHLQHIGSGRPVVPSWSLLVGDASGVLGWSGQFGRSVLSYGTCTVGMVLPKSETSQVDCDRRNINLSLQRRKHALVNLKGKQ